MSVRHDIGGISAVVATRRDNLLNCLDADVLLPALRLDDTALAVLGKNKVAAKISPRASDNLRAVTQGLEERLKAALECRAVHLIDVEDSRPAQSARLINVTRKPECCETHN